MKCPNLCSQPCVCCACPVSVCVYVCEHSMCVCVCVCVYFPTLYICISHRSSDCRGKQEGCISPASSLCETPIEKPAGVKELFQPWGGQWVSNEVGPSIWRELEYGFYQQNAPSILQKAHQQSPSTCQPPCPIPQMCCRNRKLSSICHKHGKRQFVWAISQACCWPHRLSFTHTALNICSHVRLAGDAFYTMPVKKYFWKNSLKTEFCHLSDFIKIISFDLSQAHCKLWKELGRTKNVTGTNIVYVTWLWEKAPASGLQVSGF